MTAVDGLTLSVSEGQVFGLLGPNGAGKSTLMKMLVTLLPPTSGNAKVAGYDLLRQPALVRRSIGYVPQLLSADGMLTGYENLLIFAQLYDLPRKERAARIDQALTSAGLQDVANHLVNTYSGGMIRRLEVVTAMLHRPRVLFLDEPTVGLDPVPATPSGAQFRLSWPNTERPCDHDPFDGRSGRALRPDRHHELRQGLWRWVPSMNSRPPCRRPERLWMTCSRTTPAPPQKTGEQFRDIATTRRAAARLG